MLQKSNNVLKIMKKDSNLIPRKTADFFVFYLINFRIIKHLMPGRQFIDDYFIYIMYFLYFLSYEDIIIYKKSKMIRNI